MKSKIIPIIIVILIVAAGIFLAVRNSKPLTGEALVTQMIKDSSKANPSQLYTASQTAYELGDLQSAGFLVYAARIRATFDVERFGLDQAGPAIKEWQQIEDQYGYILNPQLMRDPTMFNTNAKMIEDWPVVPSPKADYPAEVYGEIKVAEADWFELGQKTKKQFTDTFFNPFKIFLSDAKNVEALNFVNDYNFSKIPPTEENEATYVANLKIVSQGLSASGLGH
ncbi:MAG: hypothetical protein RJB39_660 [Candidatus Parcubacteria bacterium]|jgi:hypothetical protein